MDATRFTVSRSDFLMHDSAAGQKAPCSPITWIPQQHFNTVHVQLQVLLTGGASCLCVPADRAAQCAAVPAHILLPFLHDRECVLRCFQVSRNFPRMRTSTSAGINNAQQRGY